MRYLKGIKSKALQIESKEIKSNAKKIMNYDYI